MDRADLAQVAVTPLLPCRTCAATVKERALVRNVTGKPQTVTLRGSFGGTPINFGTAKIPPHSTWIAEAMVTIRHPRLWSIYRPELYRATLTLYGPKGARMAGYLTFSGIRSITLSPNGQLELNYLPLHLRGAFIHESDAALGSALDSAHRLRLVGWLRQLGGHLIRSHYPLHPQILELADEYGILVWSEIPVNHELSSYLGNPAVSAQARQMLQQSILTNGNHPSVMAWSIGNELAAPITGDEGRYIAAAAAVVRSLDPTRPVALAINDWPGLGCQSAYAPVDVLGFNDYFGWFEAGGGTTDDREGLGPFLDQLHDCYPHKALLVTEFGFDANRDGPVEERGTYAFQADSAAYHLSVFAQKPWLSGAVYFTLQEFAANPGYAGGNPLPDSVFNHKGLVDINGNAKPAFGTVASIYKATVQQGS